MDFESKALGWVANLRHQFITLCSEADAVVPQEPIEFVRNQFLSVGGTFKEFCAELLEDSLGCLEEKFLDLPAHTLRPKENPNEGVRCDAPWVNLSTSVPCSNVMEHPEETEQIGNFAEQHLAPKADYCKIRADEVNESVHSFGLSEGKEAEDSCVTELRGVIGFTQNPAGWVKVEESDDDFCSDFNMEKANNPSARTATVEEWDEDLCESDWEII